MASQHLTLHWDEHHNALVTDMENLLESNSFVDCTIAAEGQYVKAHKIVLSACSPYFQLLFKQEGEKNPIIILKDVKYEYLQLVIDFMYRGKVNVLQTQLSTFLEVAQSLQIRGLNNTYGEPTPETTPSVLPCISTVESQPSVPAIEISDDEDEDEMDCKVVDMINVINMVEEMDALPEQLEQSHIEEDQNPMTCTIQSTYSMAPGADPAPVLENPLNTEDHNWPPRAESPSSVTSSILVKAELIDEFNAGVPSEDETSSGSGVENGVTETEQAARTNNTQGPSNERYQSPEPDENIEPAVPVPNDTSSGGTQYLLSGLPSRDINLNPTVYVRRMNVGRLQEHHRVQEHQRVQERQRVVSDRELSDEGSEELVEASQEGSRVYTVGAKKMKTSSRTVNESTNTSSQSLRLVNESTGVSSQSSRLLNESTSTSSQSSRLLNKSRSTSSQSSRLLNESTSTSSQHNSNVTPRVDLREKSREKLREKPREKPLRTSSMTSKAPPSVSSTTETTPESDPKRKRNYIKRHSCPDCPRQFVRPNELAIHRRRHTGERPYTCPTCHKCFAQSSDLKRHSRVHTGEQPYA